jgi:hypothetical protein
MPETMDICPVKYASHHDPILLIGSVTLPRNHGNDAILQDKVYRHSHLGFHPSLKVPKFYSFASFEAAFIFEFMRVVS